MIALDETPSASSGVATIRILIGAGICAIVTTLLFSINNAVSEPMYSAVYKVADKIGLPSAKYAFENRLGGGCFTTPNGVSPPAWAMFLDNWIGPGFFLLVLVLINLAVYHYVVYSFKPQLADNWTVQRRRFRPITRTVVSLGAAICAWIVMLVCIYAISSVAHTFVEWLFIFPDAPLVAALSISLIAYHTLTIKTINTEGTCFNCDYILTGLNSGRCPECGTPIPQEQQTKPQETAFTKRQAEPG